MSLAPDDSNDDLCIRCGHRRGEHSPLGDPIRVYLPTIETACLAGTGEAPCICEGFAPENRDSVQVDG